MEEVDGGCLGKSKDSKKYRGQRQSEMNDASNNNEFIATAPIAPTDYYYKMDHKHRRLLIIFNHEVFNPNTKQSLRSGTNKDVDKIDKAFKKIDFEVHCFNDMTLTEIRKQIKGYVDQDHYHKHRDCLAIFVLTHGDKDALWAKDTQYNPAEELWEKFSSDKCPSLAGKPKLFFLQACQGGKLDPGVKLKPPKELESRTEVDGSFYFTFPGYADFLVFYATYEGFYAFRNDVTGSFWVTLLCEELLNHYKKTDLLTILTFVNRRLANEFVSSNKKDKSKDGKKQIAYFKSSLTRILVFGEK